MSAVNTAVELVGRVAPERRAGCWLWAPVARGGAGGGAGARDARRGPIARALEAEPPASLLSARGVT